MFLKVFKLIYLFLIMNDLDELPSLETRLITNPVILSKKANSRIGKKFVLLTPAENQFSPPLRLNTQGKFTRKATINPAVTQNPLNKNRISLLYRLIYTDDKGWSSSIVKRDASLDQGNVILDSKEETIFQAKSPFASRGTEDLRVNLIKGETPIHGFPVRFNGIEPRVEYTRTSTNDPYNLRNWDNFGILFPNIGVEEAIACVQYERYKKEWNQNQGQESLKRAKKTGKPNLPEHPFLETKNCCLWPKKVWKDLGKGKGKQQYYATIIRLLPDMQIVYIEDFKQLANMEFWQDTVSNLGEHLLLERKFDWEKSHIGLGGQPIETKEGVLTQYHGATMNPRDYRWGEALFDIDNPQKVLARTSKPVHQATEPWEISSSKNGDIAKGKIVFPTGRVINEDIVYDFYGAADKFTGFIPTTLEKIYDRLIA